MVMPSVLDFWFEFASTYSYPAAMRIAPLAREAGVTVRFRPFLLGPVFQAQGWSTSPFNLYVAKGGNMWRDLEGCVRISNCHSGGRSRFRKTACSLHASRYLDSARLRVSGLRVSSLGVSSSAEPYSWRSSARAVRS